MGKDSGDGEPADLTSITSVAQPHRKITSTEALQFFRSANFETHPSNPNERVPRKQKMRPLFILTEPWSRNHGRIQATLI
jgi:hypothetical protein